jgi:ABC-type Fe3+/spermidine/putrescine transport system ATPase subunit
VGDAVDVAIRPEAIALWGVAGAEDLDAGAAGGDGPGFDARVLQSSYLGVSVSHQVRTTGGAILTVVVPRGQARPGIGDAVRVSWRAADAMVLPRPPAAELVEEMP